MLNVDWAFIFFVYWVLVSKYTITWLQLPAYLTMILTAHALFCVIPFFLNIANKVKTCRRMYYEIILYVYIQSDEEVSVHLKITVHNSHTTDDLKMAITKYIRNVDRAILNTVFKNTVRRVNKCLETGGGHFEHYL
jgi:predicted transcriptional regulator